MVLVCGCGLWFFPIIIPTLVSTLTLTRVWQEAPYATMQYIDLVKLYGRTDKWTKSLMELEVDGTEDLFGFNFSEDGPIFLRQIVFALSANTHL